MGEPRLSKILIGTLFIGLMSLGFMLFLSGGAREYSVTGYTNSTLEKFTEISDETVGIANTAEGNLSTTSAGASSGFDIFGSFFSKAWNALKSTWASITTVSSLGSEAVDNIPDTTIDGAFKQQLKTFITISTLIILVIGIFFHFIKSSNRL